VKTVFVQINKQSQELKHRAAWSHL